MYRPDHKEDRLLTRIRHGRRSTARVAPYPPWSPSIRADLACQHTPPHITNPGRWAPQLLPRKQGGGGWQEGKKQGQRQSRAAGNLGRSCKEAGGGHRGGGDRGGRGAEESLRLRGVF